MELWKTFSEESCVSKNKAHNLGNFSTFAAIILKIQHPQCIAITVRTPPEFCF